MSFRGFSPEFSALPDVSHLPLYIPKQTSSSPLLGQVIETGEARHLTWLMFIQTRAHPLLPISHPLSSYSAHLFTPSSSLLSMSLSNLFQ